MTNGKNSKSSKPWVREMSFGFGPPTPGGWSVSFQDESDPSSRQEMPTTLPKVSNAPEDSGAATGRRSFDAAGEQFGTRLQLLLTYRREIAAVAIGTSFANVVSLFALLSEMAAASRKRNATDALASFSFDIAFEDAEGNAHQFSTRGPIYEHHHFKAVADRAKYHDAALRLLYETTVQQLVNSYERLIGDIARAHIFENTRVAAKDQTLTYEQILEFASLDEIKRAVVEAQVTDLIRNQDTLQQLKWLSDQLGRDVDVRSQYPNVNAFRGLELRRHAIVHAGGMATSEYLRRLKALGEHESASEGTQLELSSTYIEDAWDNVYALGMVTVHLASVARARRLKDAEQEANADARLNEAAFWAIGQQRYRAAEAILEYANRRTLAKTTCALMVRVNLAQTYKWQGRNEDCEKLLCEHDWEAANDQFRLCVAVLREQEDAEQYLARAAGSGAIRLSDLYEWPLFTKFRQQEEFSAIVERVFGRDARPPLEKFPASLLNFSHEETLRELFGHLDKLTREAQERGTEERDQERRVVDDGTVH